ncbi:MAG TPA: putative baseplate assembly protein [Kineosporiaceae bacterium]
MTGTGSAGCPPGERRVQARAHGLVGIAVVDVDLAGRALRLHLTGRLPRPEPPVAARVSGPGRAVRVTGVRVVRRREQTLPDLVEVSLDRLGDREPYTVRLLEAGDEGVRDRTPGWADPRHAEAGFRFTQACADADGAACCDGCGSGACTGCGAGCGCAAGPGTGPVASDVTVDYLAKDYDSFRRLLLDRLSLTSPHWADRQPADLGVTLVELLAYVGDHLSYQQDAVATEAYLGTARLRTSVRRHLRLVGYRMHDGCNARAWVQLLAGNRGVLAAGTFRFVTGLPQFADQPALTEAQLRRVPRGTYQVFEPLPAADLQLRPEHNRIQFWTWDGEECVLPAGTTCATLVDPQDEHGRRTLGLHPGDVLVIEEVRGRRTGVPGDADPRHRQAVRLTAVDRIEDPVHDQPLLAVRWASADALTFDACLRTVAGPECCLVTDVTVARGNIVLVDHGETVPWPGVEPDAFTVPSGPAPRTCCDGLGRPVAVPGRAPRFVPLVTRGPVTRAVTFPTPARVAAAQAGALDAVLDDLLDQHPGGDAGPLRRLRRLAASATAGDPVAACRLPHPVPALAGPAAGCLEQDPRAALPQLWLFSAGEAWTARSDLLGSGPDERTFVAEVGDDGLSRLRFGDGQLGRSVEPGQSFDLRLRVGNGTAGNVPAEAVGHVVLSRATAVAVQGVRNPLPGHGGIDPEPVDDARLLGPTWARFAPPVRAVVAADYATIARTVPGVQDAECELAWNGAWYEADVAVDPLGRTRLPGRLRRHVEDRLQEARRIGHDLRVRDPHQVPVDVTLGICLVPGTSWRPVAVRLRQRIGHGRAADGTLGLFHPDRLRFGSPIAASTLIAAAMAVPGVRSVTLDRLARAGAAVLPGGPPAVLEFAPDELPTGGGEPGDRGGELVLEPRDGGERHART